MRRTGFKHKPPSKYKNRRCYSVLLDRYFDSEAERRYGEHLYAREQNGEIADLQFQVRWRCQVNGVRIGRRCMYLDFRYFDKQLAEYVWDDFKGYLTPQWALKRDLWKVDGPGLLRITRERKGQLVRYVHDDIRPQSGAQDFDGPAAGA